MEILQNKQNYAKLYQGDCIELMDNIPDKSIDMIFTDLPYGTTRAKWDSVIDLGLLWEQYNRIIKDNGAILLFAQTPFDKVLGTSNLDMLRHEWIWEKTSATGHFNAKKMPLKAHENILVFYKKLPTYNPQKTRGHKPVNSFRKYAGKESDLYGENTEDIVGGGSTERYPRSVLLFPSDKQKSNYHPTQKPEDLLRYMIRTYTNPGEVILDSTMGSGSTGVAAIKEGRNFIGIELDEKYYDISKERIQEILNV